MTKKIALAMVPATCLIFVAAHAASLNVTPGLWETTVQSQMSGMPPIPQADLDKMPPQARARLQSMMANEMGKPVVTKSCLTQADIDKGFADAGRSTQDCTRSLVSGSGSEQVFNMTCKGKSAQTSGTFRISAQSPTAVSGVFDMATTGNGQTMKMHMTLTGRWLSADCGKIKPGEPDIE